MISVLKPICDFFVVLMLDSVRCRTSDGGPWTSPTTRTKYPQGGFIEDLPIGVSKSIKRIEELQDFGWVDDNTRALFVDVSFYNAQVRAGQDAARLCTHLHALLGCML